MFGRVAVLVACLLLGATSPPPRPSVTEGQQQWAATCGDWDDWDKAGPPFQVWGNTWYVGTCGISAILITGGAGHVLIDGGPVNGGSLVAANIEALGFRLSDVKLLLHSHEHHDHVGGLAELQRLTGASLLSSSKAAPVFASGEATLDDPQFGMHDAFPAARVDRIVTSGEVVRLGDLAITAVETPGHTPGAMSWQWRSCIGDVCPTIVYADSLTPVSSAGYRFNDHSAYAAAFRASIERIAQLRCTILLTPHPSASAMRETILKGRGLTNGPAHPCADYAAGLEVRLDERLFEEAGPE